MFQPDGVRRQGGMNATPARVWNTGTCRTGVWRKPRREKSHVARTTRAKVPRQCTGAEPPGGATKPGNAGRAKGWRQATCQRANAERKSHKCRLDDGSRMRRETHVRFYEGLRVQFPRSTHLGGAGWVTTGSTRKPTPTASARTSLRLLARLTAGVRLQNCLLDSDVW